MSAIASFGELTLAVVDELQKVYITEVLEPEDDDDSQDASVDDADEEKTNRNSLKNRLSMIRQRSKRPAQKKAPKKKKGAVRKITKMFSKKGAKAFSSSRDGEKSVDSGDTSETGSGSGSDHSGADRDAPNERRILQLPSSGKRVPVVVGASDGDSCSAVSSVSGEVSLFTTTRLDDALNDFLEESGITYVTNMLYGTTTSAGNGDTEEKAGALTSWASCWSSISLGTVHAASEAALVLSKQPVNKDASLLETVEEEDEDEEEEGPSAVGVATEEVDAVMSPARLRVRALNDEGRAIQQNVAGDIDAHESKNEGVEVRIAASQSKTKGQPNKKKRQSKGRSSKGKSGASTTKLTAIEEAKPEPEECLPEGDSSRSRPQVAPEEDGPMARSPASKPRKPSDPEPSLATSKFVDEDMASDNDLPPKVQSTNVVRHQSSSQREPAKTPVPTKKVDDTAVAKQPADLKKDSPDELVKSKFANQSSQTSKSLILQESNSYVAPALAAPSIMQKSASQYGGVSLTQCGMMEPEESTTAKPMLAPNVVTKTATTSTARASSSHQPKEGRQLQDPNGLFPKDTLAIMEEQITFGNKNNNTRSASSQLYSSSLTDQHTPEWD